MDGSQDYVHSVPAGSENGLFVKMISFLGSFLQRCPSTLKRRNNDVLFVFFWMPYK